MAPSRMTKLEEMAARFFEVPLTAEKVFLRAAYRRGSLQLEVCDILLALRQQTA